MFISFFFQFHHFAWNNLPLSFVIFSLFFLFGYYNRWSVKLTRVISSIFLEVFFCWTLLFLLCTSFDFFLYWSYIASCQFNRPSWLGFASSTLYFLNCFFIFDIRLLGFELYNFFSLIFLRVVSSIFFWSFFCWTLFFFAWYFFWFFYTDLISQVVGL